MCTVPIIAQLSQLNNRVNIYAIKLWHIPFVYLTIVCVAISEFENMKSNLLINTIGSILVFSGCTTMAIIWIHDNRIKKLIKLVHNIETDLGLENTMISQKVFPYYFLVFLCCSSVILITCRGLLAG